MSGLLGDDGQLVIKTKFFIGWEMGNITSKKQGKNPLIIKKKAEYIGRPHSKHCLGILKARKIQITLEQSSVKNPWKSKARALPKINVSLATKCKWAQLQKCEGKTLAIRKPDKEWTDRWDFYPVQHPLYMRWNCRNCLQSAIETGKCRSNKLNNFFSPSYEDASWVTHLEIRGWL